MKLRYWFAICGVIGLMVWVPMLLVHDAAFEVQSDLFVKARTGKMTLSSSPLEEAPPMTQRLVSGWQQFKSWVQSWRLFRKKAPEGPWSDSSNGRFSDAYKTDENQHQTIWKQAPRNLHPLSGDTVQVDVPGEEAFRFTIVGTLSDEQDNSWMLNLSETDLAKLQKIIRKKPKGMKVRIVE